jgi:hypothetical protein
VASPSERKRVRGEAESPQVHWFKFI